jgi:branched-chain amino acid transport system substrate-binding protein
MNKYLIHYLNPTTDNEERVVNHEERAIKFKFKFNARLFIFTLVILLALVLFAVLKSGLFSQEEPIYIALVHSMSDNFRDQGEAMRRGAQLYIDTVNQAGGVNGKPVKLLVFDDEGHEQKAREVALEIAKQNKALIVLGHYFSDACLKGGEVYKNAKIPAISPTCNANSVTEGNDWYFRVIPNNKLTGVFLANYVKNIMKHETVSIIYDDQDNSAIIMAEGFEQPFKELKGKIKHKWIVNANADNIDEQIENIAKELLSLKPGLLFIRPLQNREIKKLIVSMKRKGLEYPIIGTILGSMTEYPEEQLQPGYFTDGIYDVAPLIFDIAGEAAQKLRSDYREKYHEKPSPVVAMAFEAAMVAIQAMKDTQIQGQKEALKTERQQIRDYLANRTSLGKGFNGIDGRFYFDKHGNAVKPLTVGVHKHQQFISALTQFRAVPYITRITDLEKELAAGRIMTLGGQYMYKTDIVYTGIDFNEVSHLEIKNSKAEIDFYLWFRYRRGVDATHINFLNSIRDGFEELKLGEPIVDKTLPNGAIYRAYHVNGDFKEQFQFRDYPFDTQSVAVRFRHANLTRQNLIYVVDYVGMGDTSHDGILNKFKRNHVLRFTDWEIKGANFFQNTLANETTLGNPSFFGTDSNFEYSRFNAVIELKRDVLSFLTKNLLPILFLVGISYLIMFLPFGEGSVAAVSGTLVAVAFFHLSLANGLPDGIGYAVALDYAFYVIYGLIIFQLLVLVIGQREQFQENEVALKHLALTGQIVYPVVFLIAIISMAYIYL